MNICLIDIGDPAPIFWLLAGFALVAFAVLLGAGIGDYLHRQ